MSSNHIIELNQQSDGSIVMANGYYQINIQENLNLNDGDSLVMFKSYLDTTATNSNKIEIDNDTVLTIQFSKYVMDYEDDNKVYHDTVGGGISTNDYKSGQACLRVKAGGGSAAKWEIYGITFEPANNWVRVYGDFAPFVITYENPEGTSQNYHGRLDEVQFSDHQKNYTQSIESSNIY